MNDDKRTNLELRDDILKLLSDEEVALVSNEKAAPRLVEDQEYVDLDELDKGVRMVDGDPAPPGRVIARASVSAETWTEILSTLTKRD